MISTCNLSLKKGPWLTQIPLENDGGRNTRASHFEKTLFGNEMMTPVTPILSKLSQFTLALMKDSGFYEVDMLQAEYFTWGKNAGCNFVLNFCDGKFLFPFL